MDFTQEEWRKLAAASISLIEGLAALVRADIDEKVKEELEAKARTASRITR
jgi:hypothetical protein